MSKNESNKARVELGSVSTLLARIRAEHHRGRFQSAATDVDCCCLRLEILGNSLGIASMSPLRALLLAAATIGASAFAPYAGPDLERFDFEYQGLRVAGSKPRGHVVPADQGLTHNSFSGAPNGFFAPGGTAVWQAEAAFEWLLTAAFAP